MTAPDPHPWVTLLTRSFSNLWRLPTYLVLAALVALLLYGLWRSAILDERQSAAVDAARSFSAGAKPFHGRIAADEAREAAMLRGAAQTTAGFSHQVKLADSLHQVDSARATAALAAAKTAQDSIGIYQGQVAGFGLERASWKLSADSALRTISFLHAAITIADSSRDAAVRRADSAQVQIDHLLKAGECRILWVIPCIKHVSIGPTADIVSLDRTGIHYGPRQLALSVQLRL